MITANRLGSLALELQVLTGDPAKGLPEEVFLYAIQITPLINVGQLIEDGANAVHGPVLIDINQVIHPTNTIRSHFILLLFACRLTSSLTEALAVHAPR